MSRIRIRGIPFSKPSPLVPKVEQDGSIRNVSYTVISYVTKISTLNSGTKGTLLLHHFFSKPTVIIYFAFTRWIQATVVMNYKFN